MQAASAPQPSLPARQDPVPLSLPSTDFVRQSLLLRFVPFSKSTLWRRVNAELFSKPVWLSVGIPAWRAEDIHHWIAEPHS